MGPKRIWFRKFFGSEKFCVQQFFSPRILGTKNVGTKILEKKNVDTKIFESIKVLV